MAHPRIRTYHARHGRVTATMRRMLDEVAPKFAPDRRDPARPCVLEVGCGHGDAALAFADAHPDHDIVALDVHTPGVANLLGELEERPRPNLYTAVRDAVGWLEAQPPGGLAGVHVFFPDPWPKVRHHKRRFVRPDLVDLVADRLGPGAPLRFATDDADYAAAAGAVLEDHADLSGGPDDRPAWRPHTGYEARATAAGRAIAEYVYRRR